MRCLDYRSGLVFIGGSSIEQERKASKVALSPLRKYKPIASFALLSDLCDPLNVIINPLTQQPNTVMDFYKTYLIFVEMMKKFLATVLLLTYITASCGVVVNFHYCMERLASTSFFSTDKKICGKCGMHTDDANGCCRDEAKIVKLEQDQVKTSIPNLSIRPLIIPAIQHSYLVQNILPDHSTQSWSYYSPPLRSDQDCYIIHRVFRI